VLARVAKELGGVDILVNNAGWTRRVQPHSDLDSLTDDVWDRVWAVNVKGAFYCVRAAAPHMRQRGAGAVVNVTSVAAFAGVGSSMAYAASKAALTTLTKSLARALAPTIRVNAVAPGLIPTGFGGWIDVHWKATSAQTPIQRLPTADETGAAIFYLATAGGLTGQTIVLAGGVPPALPSSLATPVAAPPLRQPSTYSTRMRALGRVPSTVTGPAGTPLFTG